MADPVSTPVSNRLDGNVLAGALAELFVPEMTAVRGRCGGCGQLGPLAETVVYPAAPGLVARCGGCDQVLATVVDAGDRVFLSLSGLSAIEFRR